MFKVFLSAMAAGLLLFSHPVHAEEAEPTRVERLVMQDNLLTLWSMGLSQRFPKDQKTLCRDALFFLILAEGSACGLDREDHPEFFKDMSEVYRGYVSREKVEEAARNIFDQDVTRHVAPEGCIFDGQGYFLDFTVLSGETGNVCNLLADDLLPGYASVDVMEPAGSGNWAMHGFLRRFNMVNGEEILWKEASFRAIMYRKDGTWRIREFLFTEQAMG